MNRQRKTSNYYLGYLMQGKAGKTKRGYHGCNNGNLSTMIGSCAPGRSNFSAQH